MENGKDSNEERKLPEWKNKKISKRRKKCPMVHWGGDNVRCGTQGASFLLRRNQFDNFCVLRASRGIVCRERGIS